MEQISDFMARSCTGVTIGWFFMDVAFLPALSTYGRPLAQRDFGGVAVGLGVHRPHEVIPAHRHQDEYQWCLVLASGFEENSGRREESCGPGSLLVRPPDCVHAERFEATAALERIDLNREDRQGAVKQTDGTEFAALLIWDMCRVSRSLRRL